MLKVHFPSWEHYVAAWRYCMTIGIGFSYCREELWIAPEQYGDYDDAATMEHLREIRDKPVDYYK